MYSAFVYLAAEVTVLAENSDLTGLAFIQHPTGALVGGRLDHLFIQSVTKVVAAKLNSPEIVVAKDGQNGAIRKHFHMHS